MPFGVDDLAVAGLVLGGVSSVANFGLGLVNYDYQKDLQRSIFNREDTSIARRVQDLKASGLSPVLAAGQGAGAGGIVSTRPPEIDPSLAASLFIQLSTMQKDFAVKDKQIQVMQSQKDLNDIQTAIKSWDLSKYIQAGTASNASGLSKTIRDLFQLSQGSIAEKVKQEINEKINPSNIKIPGDKSGKTYQITPEDRERAKEEVKKLRSKFGFL